MSKYGTAGKRKYQCADCKTMMFFHSIELGRKCKPHCKGCGGTFFEPYSEGAEEMSVNMATSRAIVEHTPPVTGKEHHGMQQ